MQTSWPGVTERSQRDQWGNVIAGIHLLLCPWGKDMDQVRLEAAAFIGNVSVPDGWLYVCTHCGSRRMDKYGLGSYDDSDAPFDPYVWDQTCIGYAVLVSEEEYQKGRRVYENHAAQAHGY